MCVLVCLFVCVCDCVSFCPGQIGNPEGLQAITNLAAGVFSEMKRLQPVEPKTHSKWKRELEWLLLPLSQIVVLEPGHHLLSNGNRVSVMKQALREDVRLHLPRLRACDDDLLRVMSRFSAAEIDVEWNEQALAVGKVGRWWMEQPTFLSMPLDARTVAAVIECVSCVVEALKMVRSINNDIVRRMIVPDSYCQKLPSDASKILGKEMAKMLKKKDGSEHFDHFLNSLRVGDALQAQKMMSQLQDAALVWMRKFELTEQHECEKPKAFGFFGGVPNVSAKRGAATAERIALALRERWPKAPQTELEIAKIQGNLDVGLAAMEALSRVLEGRAATMLAHLKNLVENGAVQLPPLLAQQLELL